MKIDIEHINGVACCFNRFVLIVTLYNIYIRLNISVSSHHTWIEPLWQRLLQSQSFFGAFEMGQCLTVICIPLLSILYQKLLFSYYNLAYLGQTFPINFSSLFSPAPISFTYYLKDSLLSYLWWEVASYLGWEKVIMKKFSWRDFVIINFHIRKFFPN